MKKLSIKVGSTFTAKFNPGTKVTVTAITPTTVYFRDTYGCFFNKSIQFFQASYN